MTSKKRRGLAVAAVCAAGLVASSATLTAHGVKPGHPARPEPLRKPVRHPAYGPHGPKPPTATFFATLLGKEEVNPATGQRRAGDPDGQGGVTLAVTQGKLCFGIVVQGISSPVAAHVHQGRPRKNGPIVVTLTPPSSGDPGASSACVDAPAGVLAQMGRHPERFYVNVHTSDFPSGALRGQLHRAPHA
jgi:CHRD domain-containing protein